MAVSPRLIIPPSLPRFASPAPTDQLMNLEWKYDREMVGTRWPRWAVNLKTTKLSTSNNHRKRSTKHPKQATRSPTTTRTAAARGGEIISTTRSSRTIFLGGFSPVFAFFFIQLAHKRERFYERRKFRMSFRWKN